MSVPVLVFVFVFVVCVLMCRLVILFVLFLSVSPCFHLILEKRTVTFFNIDFKKPHPKTLVKKSPKKTYS